MVFSDLGYAWRSLRQRPGFTAVAVASLALGIGATSAIFSFVNTVVLSRLPFPDADRLYVLQETVRGKDVNGGPQRLFEWLQASSIATGFGDYGEDATLQTGDIPERVNGLRTFGGIFATLNVQPAMGRDFTPAEQRGQGGLVAIITHRLWQQRLGGDPAILGRKLVINGTPHEVVGVLPESFRFLKLDLFSPEPKQGMPRSARFLSQTIRLKPGVTQEQAQAELTALAAIMRRDHPDTDAELGLRLIPLHEDLGGVARLPLLVLLGAVGLLLLIACLNVANLAVFRATGRVRELAIRQALGASRARLVRLLFAEGVLLGIAGAGLGLLAAVWGIDLLRGLVPERFPRVDEVALDGRVVAFTMLLGVASLILCGLFPALLGARTDPAGALKSGARSTARRHALRRTLVAAEVALSLTLLVGAGLLFRTLWNLENRRLGFAPEQLLSFKLSLPWQMPEEQVHRLYARVLDGLREIPGVRDAALTDRLPLDGGTADGEVVVEAAAPGTIPAGARIGQRMVSTGYHNVMQVPLLAGRYLTEADRRAKRAVLNQTAAAAFFAGANPVGRRVALRWKKGPTPPDAFYEVVGVVGDLPNRARDAQTLPSMYVPFETAFWPLSSFVVRVEGDPAALGEAMRRKVAELDRSQTIELVQTLPEYLRGVHRTPRVQAGLVAAFAIAGLLLAALGIYGLFAQLVADRETEIGIRMALGAMPGAVQRLILGESFRLAAAGAAIGLAGAFAVSRVVESALYGVSPLDPLAFLGATALLGAVALGAAYLPARRAAQTDPIKVLRRE